MLGYGIVGGLFLSILDRLRVVLFDIIEMFYERYFVFESVLLLLVLSVVKVEWLRYDGEIWVVLNFYK